MDLLLNVHKRQFIPQLRKIMKIMQNKIQEFRQLEHDDANSHRFEIGYINKTYYTIKIFIQLFKEVSLKIMWYVEPVSSDQAYLQEVNEFLNNYPFTLVLQ
jgi:hypothetical protein